MDLVRDIIVLICLWALIFGVTVDSKHYGLHGCSCENGVKIDAGGKL